MSVHAEAVQVRVGGEAHIAAVEVGVDVGEMLSRDVVGGLHENRAAVDDHPLRIALDA